MRATGRERRRRRARDGDGDSLRPGLQKHRRHDHQLLPPQALKEGDDDRSTRESTEEDHQGFSGKARFFLRGLRKLGGGAMADRRVHGGSSVAALLEGKGILHDSLIEAQLGDLKDDGLEGFAYQGRRDTTSKACMEGVCENAPETDGGFFFHRPPPPFEPEDPGSEDDDAVDVEFDHHRPPAEKKRRLTADQVQLLEKTFEAESKLEQDRKAQLAGDLGLQPRQVAIWFQNRRARWKTKQLERDFDALRTSYESLKSDYEGLAKEKEELKAEIVRLTGELLLLNNNNNNDNKHGDTFTSEIMVSSGDPGCRPPPSDQYSGISHVVAAAEEEVARGGSGAAAAVVFKLEGGSSGGRRFGGFPAAGDEQPMWPFWQ